MLTPYTYIQMESYFLYMSRKNNVHIFHILLLVENLNYQSTIDREMAHRYVRANAL